MKKSLITLAVGTALGLVSVNASAYEFQDFTVDETSVPGSSTNLGAPGPGVIADKMAGIYNEILRINLDTSFETSAYAQFTSFAANEGTVAVPSLLNTAEAISTQGYGMYALFSATGTYDGTNFNGGSALFDLYIDPTQDTTFGLTDLPAGVGVDVTDGNNDDYKIAFSTNTIVNSGDAGTSPGGFRIVWNDFELTTAGESYFIEPTPFHMIVDVTGDFDANLLNVAVDPVKGYADFTVTGEVSATYIPEPASLALMGLGLLGMGATLRRRKS